VRVKFHTGYSGCDQPREITWNKESLEITKIMKEWREPEAKHFLVETGKGRTFKLAYFFETGEWTCSEFIKEQ